MKIRSSIAMLAIAAAMLTGCTSGSGGGLPLESTGIKVPEFTVEQKELPQSEALDFVKDMKLGWNLGNTLDAIGHQTNELDSETAWCGVKTTEEMILAVKAAGFNTVRVPVSWHDHVDDNNKISDVWLDRVQEVVDYAYKNGMYVILNIHHDTDKKYCYPSYEKLETSKKYITDIWQQLAERFKDYSSKLIFETMNEPRLIGTSNEWWIDPERDIGPEAIDCINQLNQTAVDTIRSTGGNNSDRYIMVPGYAANYEYTISDRFVLPNDSADNKILVSIHAYLPYHFALSSASENGSTGKFDASSIRYTKQIDDFLKQIYDRFTSQGIGVVIGEFGARDRDGNTEARANYAAYYVAAARTCGITCVWWDNNALSGNGELFGILDRKNMQWAYPDIVLALVENCE